MNDTEIKVLNSIDDAEVVDFLVRLIQCKSTYPPGDSREVAKLCAEKLMQAGIEAEVVYPDSNVKSIWNDNVQNNNIPSVVAKLKGTQERPVLALNAHIDTVGIPDINTWKFDPFSGVIENGLIYGRGAGDDKGSVCAQIMAAAAIARSGVKLKGTLVYYACRR